MSNNNDTSEIIKQFLDIWQKQFAYAAKEPENVSAMLRMFFETQSWQQDKQNNVKSNSNADIHGYANDELQQLRRGIASFEERIVKLESKLTGASNNPPKKNPTTKSGKTGARAKKSAN